MKNNLIAPGGRHRHPTLHLPATHPPPPVMTGGIVGGERSELTGRRADEVIRLQREQVLPAPEGWPGSPGNTCAA